MEVVGLVFSLFTVGYILGVWTACLVFRQPQREYEEGAPWRATDGAPSRAPEGALAAASARVIVLRNAPRVPHRLR